MIYCIYHMCSSLDLTYVLQINVCNQVNNTNHESKVMFLKLEVLMSKWFEALVSTRFKLVSESQKCLSVVQTVPCLSVQVEMISLGGFFQTSDLLCGRLLVPHQLLVPQRGLQLLDVKTHQVISAPHLGLKAENKQEENIQSEMPWQDLIYHTSDFSTT